MKKLLAIGLLIGILFCSSQAYAAKIVLSDPEEQEVVTETKIRTVNIDYENSQIFVLMKRGYTNEAGWFEVNSFSPYSAISITGDDYTQIIEGVDIPGLYARILQYILDNNIVQGTIVE